jgi:hypothetical protein
VAAERDKEDDAGVSAATLPKHAAVPHDDVHRARADMCVLALNRLSASEKLCRIQFIRLWQNDCVESRGDVSLRIMIKALEGGYNDVGEVDAAVQLYGVSEFASSMLYSTAKPDDLVGMRAVGY